MLLLEHAEVDEEEDEQSSEDEEEDEVEVEVVVLLELLLLFVGLDFALFEYTSPRSTRTLSYLLLLEEVGVDLLLLEEVGVYLLLLEHAEVDEEEDEQS